MIMRKLTRIPGFPFLPFVPLFFVGGVVTLELVTLRAVRKLARRLDSLAVERGAFASP